MLQTFSKLHSGFIDFLPLMLVTLVAGMLLFSIFFFFFLEDGKKKMAPGFLLVGALELITGLDIILTWPLPSSYNIAFGEPATLFGAIFFFLGLALLFDWDLLTLGVIGILGGIMAIIVGVRLAVLHMTSEPVVAMLGFVLTGIVGIAALPGYALRRSTVIRFLVALASLGSAIIWAITAYASYWAHLVSFAKFTP